MVWLEPESTDMLEKVFYKFEVDQTRYDLFIGNINICEAQWDFRNDTGGKPYRFVRKSWQDIRRPFSHLEMRKLT